MESVIAGLLKDFEDGRMSRRQLIQSLAMAAAAAAAPGTLLAQTPAAPQAQGAFGKAPWKTVWLDHISFQVADYKRSVEFYTNLMGWEVQNDTGSQATLKIGDVGGIIVRNSRRGRGANGGQGAGTNAPGGATASNGQTSGGGQEQAQRPPITGVIDHISWGVDPWDTDKVKAELERRGLNPRPDMQGNDFKSFHVKDPDGWDLQISNQTKDSRG